MKLKENTAYHITVQGEIIEIAPKNGRDFQLEEVQSLVDGYIEVLFLSSDRIMIINECGKFTKSYNEKATQIAHSNHAIRTNDYISGDVIVCLLKQLP